MAKCIGCGTELPVDAVFCPQCGGRATIQPAPTMPAAGTATISDVVTMPGGGVPRTSPTLAEGQQFHGRYTIERQLGAGAMGVVYAAKDQVTGRSVALKLINPALADRPTARERFLREGLMARDVRHAKIVAMYDVGEADGQIYLVMEYLSGETLRKWLRRMIQNGGDISFDTVRGIIRSILEGLAAAHATGVVHRDLKPENVMLMADPQAGDYSLKILDFGIARAVGATSHVTTTSSSTGTPLYMAPEQKTAADTVGPSADLYAVTAMLYELLLGVAPEGRWGAPSRERDDLPSGIDAIIEKGLANRPRSRYQSAEEYIKALDAVAPAPGSEGVKPLEPVLPPPPVPPPKPPPPVTPPAPSGPSKLVAAYRWLRLHSPGWVLWDRLSKRQRFVLSAVLLLAAFALIGYSLVPKSSPPYGVLEPPGGTSVEPPVTPPVETPPPETKDSTSKTQWQEKTREPVQEPEPQVQPPPPQDMNIAGRWADELAGTGMVVTFSDVFQQGNLVSGHIYDSRGNHAGRFSGRVSGTYLQYDYTADNGITGTGRGQLRADGIHLDIEVQDHLVGNRERHTLHKNHMPPG